MIFGPKDDGTYVVEFRTAAGEVLAISIPRSEAAVIRYFQERMPYGLFVPEAGAATRGPGPFPNAAGVFSIWLAGKLRAPTGMRRARTLPSICPLRVDDPSASLAYGTPMPIKLPKPPPPLSGLALTVVKLRLLRWCLAQNIHYR